MQAAAAPLNLERGTFRAVDVFRTLVDHGWTQRRISGSHHIFSRDGCRSLPVAVHGGKLRRDVVQNVMRQAALHTSLLEASIEVASSATKLQPAETRALGSDAPCPQRIAPDTPQRRWVESSSEEQAAFSEQAEVAEKVRQEESVAFQGVLQAAQLELLDGNYAAVDSRLTHILSDGCERLCERFSYAFVADALFFLATALCFVAMGSRPVGEAPSQQLITRAFSTCKELLQLRERRDDAKQLLASLLSWVYHSYARDLLTLAMSQATEEFSATDRLAYTFASMTASSSDADLVGQSARIEGLKSRADLNGRGCKVESFVAAKERFQVHIDGSQEKMLLKRLNLRLPEMERQSARLVGGHSEALDSLNRGLLQGFGFVVRLARADQQLDFTVLHDDVPWPREGIEAIARAAITHYERGHISEACTAFEAIDFVCAQHARAFDEAQQEEWRLIDAVAPGLRERKMRQGTGASQVLGTAMTMRALSQACLRMRGAHVLAAEDLLWARGLGFSVDPKNVSKPMREGWSAVFAAAELEQACSRRLNWVALASFMDIFFKGMDFSVKNRNALRTPQAILFVTHNLIDPVKLIAHHCGQLHLGSKILSCALVGQDGLTGSVVHGCEGGALDHNWPDQIARPQHHQLREQLVKMLLWTVQLRQLFHELDDLVEAQITSGGDGGGLVSARLAMLNELAAHLKALLITCCQARPKSTLLDILIESLDFHQVLDYQRYVPSLGTTISELDPGVPVARSKGMFVMQMCNHLPLFLRWFTANDAERKSLAVKYKMMNTLKGFAPSPFFANEEELIRDASHDGQFCARAFEMLELLHKLGGAALKWETVADVLLSLTGATSASRQARRSAVVQRKARRICNVVSSVSARFPTPLAGELCERRVREYDALLSLLDKLVRALLASRPSAAAMPIGDGFMLHAQIESMAARMPELTAYDLHQLSMHAVALTELATEVNTRMREAFGGNFPELVWAKDCYEYNPSHAHLDMQSILENQADLADAVKVLSRAVADGLAGSTSLQMPSPEEFPESTHPASDRPSSSQRRGGKKGGKKGGQSTLLQSDYEIVAAGDPPSVTSDDTPSRSTIDDQD